MLVREVIDIIQDQLSLYEDRTKVDGKTIWRFLNNARREVFSRMLPVKEQGFTKVVQLGHGSPLPADFSRVIRVYATTSVGIVECRQADPREWWDVTNPVRQKSFTSGNARSPVYCLWGEILTGGRVSRLDNTLGILPLTLTDPNRDKVFFYISPSVSATMEYNGNYADLPVDVNGNPDLGVSIQVPYEYEELVLLLTKWRCFLKVMDKAKWISLNQTMMSEEQRLRKAFIAREQTKSQELLTLIAPQPSVTPDL